MSKALDTLNDNDTDNDKAFLSLVDKGLADTGLDDGGADDAVADGEGKGCGRTAVRGADGAETAIQSEAETEKVATQRPRLKMTERHSNDLGLTQNEP